MQKEPLGLYIFRFFVGLIILGVMTVLYWSNTLIEKDIQMIKSDIEQLDHSLDQVLSETQKIRRDVLETLLLEQENNRDLLKGIFTNRASIQSMNEGGKAYSIFEDEMPVRESKVQSKRSHLSNEYPNLLQEDPYFTEVLPKILPPRFRPHGERRVATIGKPEDLHPFSNWAQVAALRGLCVPSLATNFVGRFDAMSPELAIKIELRTEGENGPEYWVHLREGVFWEPLDPDQFPSSVKLAPIFLQKHPVTSGDFKFFYDAMMNPSNQESRAASLRTYYGDIEEFLVIDDLTFVVRWKQERVGDSRELKMKFSAKDLTAGLSPLPQFVYKHFSDGSKIVEDDSNLETYREHSVWAQNFAEHWAKNVIVSCGPWIFEKMTEKEVRFIRNPAFFNQYSALYQTYVQKFKDSPESIWQSFKSGQFDYIGLTPTLAPEWEKFKKSEEYKKLEERGLGIEEINFVDRLYAYVGWNEKKPYFNTRRVRQALTMAIDRSRIIEYNLNGKGIEITGPFFRFSPSYDPLIDAWPYDPKEAKRLLEKEGWFDSDGDGILDKEINGKRVPFKFTMTYPVKNTTSKPIVEYIVKALSEIGIECQLSGVEIADLTNAFDEKSFDAIYLGWSLGKPPENPRQLWHSSGANKKGSSNGIGFDNKEADRIINSLDYEYDENKRAELYHRFHKIVHNEAPYVFLYTPKSTLLYRRYMKNVFIPAERPDLIPGADISEPDMSITWVENKGAISRK